ncbi:2-hydroxyglutaryl-CoA dehydratase, D-component [Moorella glycerini]|uniref:R-phenyllactate dehydratase subunit alpha n=1 Tax=Neomoorella stamsii TaxID=1266720 RepID=A0A9X7J3U2_9FIRM|nr:MULTISPECIES: 2-hydroxyacyl-CoA dehydratase family protein [Moorella]PRR72389.1 R-phenyllactate dehydratase subunit alpha precursor [Moorella stamsii]CEP67398.1 2-hydroxyglutaryl-CoA dehydratase, D-component [Moorella glycerini]
MDIYQFIRSHLAGPLRQRAFKSPWTYRLLKQLVAAQKNRYSWQAAHLMLLNTIDQVAAAYLQQGPVVWHNVFFPTEILYGLGLVPFAPEAAAAVAVGMGVAEEAFRVAEGEWVSGESCSFHRLAYGCDRAGYLPPPGAVVCSSHLCDAAPQSLAAAAGYHHVPFYLLDVPHRQDAAAINYVARQLKSITFSLAEALGVPWDQERFQEAVIASNTAREHLLAVNRLRRQRPAYIRGDEAHGFIYLMLAGFGSEAAAAVYRQLAAELEQRWREQRRAVPEERARLLWLHLRPYYPTEIFNLLEQEAGAVVVFEEMHHVYWEPLDPARPFYSLAGKVLSHHGLGCMSRRIEAILAMVDAYQVDGVIHFAHWGCRQSTAGLRMLQDALRDREIPFLNLEGDCVDKSKYAPGAIRTRLEGFLEMLRAV